MLTGPAHAQQCIEVVFSRAALATYPLRHLLPPIRFHFGVDFKAVCTLDCLIEVFVLSDKSMWWVSSVACSGEGFSSASVQGKEILAERRRRQRV